MRGITQRLPTTIGILILGIGGTLVVERVGAVGVPSTSPLVYAGVLTRVDGTVANGTMPISVAFFSAEIGGVRVCDAMSAPAAVNDGRFQVTLPQDCAAAIHANADLWVQVEVEGTPLDRRKLGLVPYALEAGHATGADKALSADRASAADKASTAEKATTADRATTAASAESLSKSQLTCFWRASGVGAPITNHWFFDRVGGVCKTNELVQGIRFRRAGCGKDVVWTSGLLDSAACQGQVTEATEGLEMQLYCCSLT